MGRIRGITVQLVDKQKTGVDGFGRPVYEEVVIDVDNVIVGEPTSEEVVDVLNLTGKHLAYTLAIPKGDTHTWTDREVRFFDERFKTIGKPTQGLDHLIPLSWNKKVKVALYE